MGLQPTSALGRRKRLPLALAAESRYVGQNLRRARRLMVTSVVARSSEALLRFEWAVRALAQEADCQLSLFPGFVVVADELALDFEHHHRNVEDTLADLGDAVSASVAALDAMLDSMSGPAHPDLWTDAALRDAPEWRDVRVRARTVLDAAGWPSTPPPQDRSIYVGPDS